MSKVKERLSGSLALTKLKHVKMNANGKSGKVEGIFIPIKANYLVKGKVQKDEQGNDIAGSEPIYMPVDIVIFNERDQRGQDGMIPQKLGSEDYKKLVKEDGQEINLPILGNVKNFSNSTPNENTGDEGGGKSFEPEDDLPW